MKTAFMLSLFALWLALTGPQLASAQTSAFGNILGGYDVQDSGTNSPTGNRYSPWVMRVNGVYHMWYGAQNIWGRDQIHYARSSDGVQWQKIGVVIPHGQHLHKNDPTVVRVGGTYYMY